jgi:hypothetical protein
LLWLVSVLLPFPASHGTQVANEYRPKTELHPCAMGLIHVGYVCAHTPREQLEARCP